MRSQPAPWPSPALQYLYDRAKATIENNFFRKVASYRDKEVSVRAAGHAVGAAGLGLAARRSPRCRPAHLAQSPRTCHMPSNAHFGKLALPHLHRCPCPCRSATHLPARTPASSVEQQQKQKQRGGTRSRLQQRRQA